MSEMTLEQEKFILEQAEKIKAKQKEQTKTQSTIIDLNNTIKKAETTDVVTITETTSEGIEISGDTTKTEKVTSDYTITFVDENGEEYTKTFKDRGLKPIYDDIVANAFMQLLACMTEVTDDKEIVFKEERKLVPLSITRQAREGLLGFIQTFFDLEHNEVPTADSLFNVSVEIIDKHPEIVKRAINFMGKS